MTVDTNGILAITDAMKARGVRSFEVPGVLRVDFGAPESAPLKSDAAPAENGMCACGCPLVGHMGGMCVTAGCTPEKCEAKK